MDLVIALLEVDIRVGVTAIWFSVPGAMWNLKERKTIGHSKFLLHTPMWDLKKKTRSTQFTVVPLVDSANMVLLPNLSNPTYVHFTPICVQYFPTAIFVWK